MFVFLREKINQCAARVGAFVCNAGFLFMAALVWLVSAWRVVLTTAGAIAFVSWMWALAGVGAALFAALIVILAGALVWLVHTNRI